MRCWCLHGVAVLKSEVFHKHVDMSGIVLINNSSLSPAQRSVQLFDALMTRNGGFFFDWIDTCHLVLKFCQSFCRSYEHEVIFVLHS